MNNNQLKTVTKSIEVLKKIVYSDTPWGPREIARELDIEKSSAQRILHTLRHNKILSYDESAGKYSCGPELIRLSIALKNQNTLSQIATPIIKKYVQKIRENIALFTYYEGKIVFECTIEAENELTSHLKVGLPYEIYRGCSGKVALANLPDKEAESLYQCFDEKQLCNVPALRRQVQDCKEKGYAFSFGERVLGMVGFSAPIYGQGNAFKGGVNLALPDVRYHPENHGKFSKVVIECANEISSVINPASETSFDKK